MKEHSFVCDLCGTKTAVASTPSTQFIDDGRRQSLPVGWTKLVAGRLVLQEIPPAFSFDFSSMIPEAPTHVLRAFAEVLSPDLGDKIVEAQKADLLEYRETLIQWFAHLNERGARPAEPRQQQVNQRAELDICPRCMADPEQLLGVAIRIEAELAKTADPVWL